MLVNGWSSRELGLASDRMLLLIDGKLCVLVSSCAAECVMWSETLCVVLGSWDMGCVKRFVCV